MSVPSIVITGANSYLGRVAVEFLREKTAHRLVAVVSPRAELPGENERVRYLRADLAAAPDTAFAAELAQAACVLHFAWTRTGSADAVSAANCTCSARCRTRDDSGSSRRSARRCAR